MQKQTGAPSATLPPRFTASGGAGGGAITRVPPSSVEPVSGGDESVVSMPLSRISPGRRGGSHPPPGRQHQYASSEASGASGYDGGSGAQQDGALSRALETIEELRAALDASNQAAAAAAAELMQTKAQLGTAWRRLVAADTSVGTTRGFWTREAFLGQVCSSHATTRVSLCRQRCAHPWPGLRLQRLCAAGAARVGGGAGAARRPDGVQRGRPRPARDDARPRRTGALDDGEGRGRGAAQSRRCARAACSAPPVLFPRHNGYSPPPLHRTCQSTRGASRSLSTTPCTLRSRRACSLSRCAQQ